MSVTQASNPALSIYCEDSPNPGFVQLENLSKSFQEGAESRTVLKQVDETFQTGEFVALLGQSGSDKVPS